MKFSEECLKSNGWKLQFKFDQTNEVWKNKGDDYVIVGGNTREVSFRGNRRECSSYIMEITEKEQQDEEDKTSHNTKKQRWEVRQAKHNKNRWKITRLVPSAI